MKTSIQIDDRLIATAGKLTNIKSKEVLVDNALRLYVGIESQKKLKELWGKIDLDDIAYE